MKIIIKISVLLTILSTLGCGAGIGDEAVDLGSGYVYRSDGDLRWIYSKDSYFENGIQGNVQNYNYDDKFIIVSQAPSKNYYKWRFTNDLIYKFKTIDDDTSITENKDIHKRHFLQSPCWSDAITRQKIYASFSNHKDNASEAVQDVVYKILENTQYFRSIVTSKVNFWIIIKQRYEVIGPMNKSKFESERSRLGIDINFKTNH